MSKPASDELIAAVEARLSSDLSVNSPDAVITHLIARIRQQDAEIERLRGAAEAEREEIGAKALEYAAHYPARSDARNTFIIFAEWIANREWPLKGGAS